MRRAEQSFRQVRQQVVFEAVELRDNDKKRYGGKGVKNAVANVNEKLQMC